MMMKSWLFLENVDVAVAERALLVNVNVDVIFVGEAVPVNLDAEKIDE